MAEPVPFAAGSLQGSLPLCVLLMQAVQPLPMILAIASLQFSFFVSLLWPRSAPALPSCCALPIDLSIYLYLLAAPSPSRGYSV